jgi:hypothetical protein
MKYLLLEILGLVAVIHIQELVDMLTSLYLLKLVLAHRQQWVIQI